MTNLTTRNDELSAAIARLREPFELYQDGNISDYEAWQRYKARAMAEDKELANYHAYNLIIGLCQKFEESQRRLARSTGRSMKSKMEGSKFVRREAHKLIGVGLS